MALAFRLVILGEAIPSTGHICFLPTCTSDTPEMAFAEKKDICQKRGLLIHLDSGQNLTFRRSNDHAALLLFSLNQVVCIMTCSF